MPDLKDGESTEMKGSGTKPYVLKNSGGVYSCSCPAWRNQSTPIEKRTCKHLKKLRGENMEAARCGEPMVVMLDDEPGVEKWVPPLLLANSWDGVQDLTGWWMSEKFDGVRAYWNGTSFFSREGNEFLAPDWFLSRIPTIALDGELWMGRGKFQECSGIVRRKDRSDLWKGINYHVFDAPTHAEKFEERIVYLKDLLQELNPPRAKFVHHYTCRGIDYLKNELKGVEAGGGEGLMLREPGSLYEAGRSSTLLKVKSFHDDEALVIGYSLGKGKFKGMVGALNLEMKSGKLFSAGSGLTDAERKKPPPIGSVVTFRYKELTKDGIPREPTFVRVRTDVDSAKFMSTWKKK